MDDTLAFYSRPSHEYRGAGFPVFAGSRRQRGGSIFGSLKRLFLPVAKNIGKNILKSGIGLARDVASDAMMGKDIKDSLLKRGKAAAFDVGSSAAKEGLSAMSELIGSGSRRYRRRHRSLRKRRRTMKRKSVSRKPASRKRKARSKSIRRRAKRRRTNF